MPAYLPKVIELVKAKIGANKTVDDALLEETVRATIETIGLGIANDGEIYNPAPPPSTVVQPQMHARWSGGRSRGR